MGDFLGIVLFRTMMLGMALLSLTSFFEVGLTTLQVFYLGIFCASVSAFYTAERGMTNG